METLNSMVIAKPKEKVTESWRMTEIETQMVIMKETLN